MKLPKSLSIHRLLPTNRRGVALVTVLTVMSLTTILILTFFSLATSEHRASRTYSQGLQAQQVAEQAVNMVIGQIREATQVGVSDAWASQPGALRRWDGSGNLRNIYKLYSDDLMKSNDPGEVEADYTELRSWNQKPAQFVDLNEPVIRGEKVYYPIVNPMASSYPEWPREFHGDDNGVEGFSYQAAAVAQGRFGQKAAQVGGAQDGHLAMPVRWLYQLADGTIGVLSGSGAGSGFQFSPISGSGTPSDLNQIVARFAFWADDETSKLNVNTHAGGVAWDVPKAGGRLDLDMAQYQPIQKEWQRYPGHPATTHLAPVLAPGVVDYIRDNRVMERIYDVVPRVVPGGSEGGERTVNPNDPRYVNGMIPDSEPLFPSIDDMIMRSDRTHHRYPDANGRALPREVLSEYLERSKFFLTAYSRAPEVNIFNRPRVTMWPIFDAERSSSASSDYQTRLTAFDRLIHYCSTLGGDSSDRYDYIFRRRHADHPTYDYNQIPRNRALYSYLDDAMRRTVPGYGGSFQAKYGADQQQILTQIFDYIRSTNLHDDSLFGDDPQDAFTGDNTDNHLTYTNPRQANNKGRGHKGHGQVVPIKIGDTKGFGRFHTLSSVQVLAICAGAHLEETIGNIGLFPGYFKVERNGDFDQVVEGPSGEFFLNIPPWRTTDGVPGNQEDWRDGLLPQHGGQPNATRVATWPQWLRDLANDINTGIPSTSNPSDVAELLKEYRAAFNAIHWNWQLAFLDSSYRSTVLSDPNQRYNLSVLGADSEGTVTRLQPGERMQQGALLFNLYNPSIGWNAINPDLEIEIESSGGMAFSGIDGSVPFLGLGHGGDGFGSGSDTYLWATNSADSALGSRRYGGTTPFPFLLRGDNQPSGGGDQRRLTPVDRGWSASRPAHQRYDLVTIPFRSSGNSCDFNGGELTFRIYPGRDEAEDSAPTLASSEPVQTISIDFGSFSVPAPRFDPDGRMGSVDHDDSLRSDSYGPLEFVSLTHDSGLAPGYYDPNGPGAKLSARLGGGGGGEPRGRMSGDSELFEDGGSGGNTGSVESSDVVQSVGIRHGDVRLVAAQDVINSSDTYFAEHRNFGNGRMGHSLTRGDGWQFPGSAANDVEYNITNLDYRGAWPLPFVTERSADVQLYGDFDNGAGLMIDGPYINKPDEGNFHQLSALQDSSLEAGWQVRLREGRFPYFNQPGDYEPGGPAYFSPNRLIPGPGMLGSLPTGVERDLPWQTLLFRPNVVGNGFESHPGAEDPPDHLIMDLFWMPVVEPYAISEPMSTAGKININHEIVPFLHVNRTSALRGVLRSEFMLCVPNEFSDDYKHEYGRGRGYDWLKSPTGGAIQKIRLRTTIVEPDTLAQLDDRFQNGRDIYKVASEFCEIHLVGEEVADRFDFNVSGISMGHETPSVQQMASGEYWSRHLLVGDNAKERPYANIIPRLTTKSNTFKVHFRAQVLKQARRDDSSGYAQWNPELDTVQAEYRGSSIVERYIDPNDPDIPDFANSPSATVDEFYQYRVVNPRRFSP